MRKIIVLDDLVKRDGKQSVQEWILWKCRESIGAKKIETMWDGKSVEGEAVLAFVNNGRWLGRCKVCSNPIYVSWETRILYCPECGNGGSTSAWPVQFPEEREEIEKALLKREVVVPEGKYIRNEVEAAMNARPKTSGLARSWRPGVSVAQLEAETVRRGDKRK